MLLASIRDPNGEFDMVLIMFIVGFLVACFKLLIAGNTLWGIEFSAFGGGDFAMVTGALGGVYHLRRHDDGRVRKEKKVNENTN